MAKEGGTGGGGGGGGDEKIKRKGGLGWEVGLRDVVPGLPGERGTDLSRCPSVRLYRRPDSRPRGSTMLLTSCEFKQLSFCEVIPNALK